MNSAIGNVKKLLEFISNPGSIYYEQSHALAQVIAELESRPAAPVVQPHQEPIGRIKDFLKGTDHAYRRVEWADRTFAMDVPDGAFVYAAPFPTIPAAPVVAEGWQIVPSHATPEMLKAFFAEDYTQNGYIEMLKAAPAHPVAGSPAEAEAARAELLAMPFEQVVGMVRGAAEPMPASEAQKDALRDLEHIKAYIKKHGQHGLLVRADDIKAALKLTAAPVPASEAPKFKDHNIRQLVNDLRDIAIKFHAAQQLRARISDAVGQFLAAPAAPTDAKSVPDVIAQRTESIRQGHSGNERSIRSRTRLLADVEELLAHIALLTPPTATQSVRDAAQPTAAPKQEGASE